MSVEWCCDHNIHNHSTLVRDAEGGRVTSLGCDLCDCTQYGFTSVPERWWQKEIGFKVWVLIAVILINLVASVVHGAYIGWNSGRDMKCVEVRHDDPSEDYMVCGEKQAVRKDFD